MVRVVPVDDPDDPRVADYRDVRERDLVGRRGLFVAEGEVVLGRLLSGSRHRPRSALIDAGRLEKLAPLLAEAPDDLPVYAASRAVLDAVAGFPLHRGVLAIGERAPDPGPEALLAAAARDPQARVVVLFGTANHDNMGGVFRNAAAFGASAVLLDATCCDPLYRKALRVSVGAVLRLPFARIAAGVDALDLLARHGFQALALSPAGETPLHALEVPPRAAVLFGAEGPGLPEAVLARARTVSIPMAGGLDSLNLAASSAVVLHHLAFGPRA